LGFVFKKIILSLVPYKLIRGIRKKINLSYLFFGPSKKNIGRYIIHDEKQTFRLYGMEQTLDSKVINGFQQCYKQYRSNNFIRKYILQVDDCIIEPEYGWAITEAGDDLVFDSISNNSWIEVYHPKYFKYKKNKKNAIAIEEAVVINMVKGGENNYWHFLHDLLGQIMMARTLVKNELPFIISKAFSVKPYFIQALQISHELRTINWIIRDDKYFHVKKAWFLQTMPNSNEQFHNVRALLDVPDGDATSGLRVFLTRSEKRIRFVKNRDVIETIAKKYGFKIIDTDVFSLPQQIELFSKTRYLVGIHGAGLTNLIFRKNAPLTLLELLPGDYIQPHYFWLCKGMGHDYDCLVGSVSGIDTSFEIDPLLFEERIISLLK